jgi:hypothetical protein
MRALALLPILSSLWLASDQTRAPSFSFIVTEVTTFGPRLEPWDRPMVRAPQMSYGFQCGDFNFSAKIVWCVGANCQTLGRCTGGILQLDP